MNEYNKLPDRYHIECVLGKGGLGKVLKVYDSVLERTLALKILSALDKASKSAIIKEFTTLSELNHPNLVQVHNFGFLASQIPYFTMEFVDGIDLRQFLKKKNSTIHILSIIKQILAALDYLHKNGILHGDIKPENIQVIKDKDDIITIKIVDFGLAMRIAKKYLSVCGTPRFLPPEVISNAIYSQSSDLYALGMSLIECITSSNVPISTKINKDFYYRVKNIINERLVSEKTKYPSFITSFILSLAQSNPEDRPKNTREALQNFLMIIDETNKIPKLQMENIFIDRKIEIENIDKFLKTDNTNDRVIILEGVKGVGKKSLISKGIQLVQPEGYIVIDLASNIFIHNSLDKFVSFLADILVEDQKSLLFKKHNKLLSLTKKKIRNGKYPYSIYDSSPIIYDNIIQFLHKLSLLHPIIICLPDIERFGMDFIRFIHHIPFETDFLKSKIKLILSRNIDIPFPKNKQNLFNEIKQSSFSSTLKVNPFNTNKLKTFIVNTFGRVLFSNKDYNNLLTMTNGTPLFLIELLKNLLNKNVIQWETGEWHLDYQKYRKTSIPDSIYDIIEQQFKNISHQDNDILRIIAFWKEPISIENLMFLSNMDSGYISKRISILEKKNIIKISSNKTIEFDKQIYSEFVIKHTPSKSRKMIYNNIAKALEGKKPTDTIRLAKYYIESRIVDNALKYGLKAGDQLFSKNEFYDCLLLLSNLKKLVLKDGTDIEIIKVIEKIAPIERITGLTKIAIEDYNRLIEYSEDTNKKAYYFKELGLIYDDSLGQEEKAKELYTQALQYARKSNDFKLKAEILIKLGELTGNRSHHYLRKAIQLTKQKDVNTYAIAMAKLLYFYKISGDIRKMDILLKDINMIINKVDLFTKKEILFYLIIIHFYKGDYKNVKKYISEKSSIEKKILDELENIDSLKALGGYYYIQGNFIKTIKVLKDALIISRKYNKYLTALMILSNLSLTYRHLAKYDELLLTIEQAEKIIKLHKISQVSSTFLIKPAYLYLMFGDVTDKEFRSYLLNTFKKASKYNNTIVLGHRQLILSQYHYQRLNMNRTLRHAFKALELFKDADDKDDIVEALINISIYLIEQDKLNKASKHLIDAQRIYNKIHCEYLKPSLLFAEGSLARAFKENNSQESLRKALNISKKMGTRETTWQIQRELALCYKDIGQLHKAFNYYNDSIETIKQITESITNEEIKISYLSIPYRKRVFKEIKSLKKELT